jgi:RimJ/RimL family protein N-acetyltransferase
VEQKESGELLGCRGFSPYLETDQIELSYTFARRQWGRGFASEAAQACLNFAQDHFAWPSVLARSHPENFASRRVLEKLGFRFHRLELEHRDGPAIFYLLEMRTNSPARAIADVEDQNRVMPGVQSQ